MEVCECKAFQRIKIIKGELIHIALTKKQEKQLNGEIKKTLEEVRFQGLKDGAAGILGAVLEMCNSGKTDAEIVKDIKDFCEKSLNMDGMK